MVRRFALPLTKATVCLDCTPLETGDSLSAALMAVQNAMRQICVACSNRAPYCSNHRNGRNLSGSTCFKEIRRGNRELMFLCVRKQFGLLLTWD